MRAIASVAVALVLAFASLWPAARAEAPAGDQAEMIRSVIEQQLEAFQVDDGDRAFAFASPNIKRMFQTPERFMAMVRQGYQPVYRPQEVRFLDVIDVQGTPTQRVLLIGPDGKVVVAYYGMEQQPDGGWKISGCVLQEGPGHSI